MSGMYGVPRRTIVRETWFWVAMAFILALAIFAVVWVVRYYSADERGRAQAREQIQSGPSRVAAYNHFFDLCAAVQTDEATLQAQREELATNPSESRRGQIQANIAALKSGRAEKINSYNADARKDYTIGQFRSSGLPYQLVLTQEVTTCDA